MRVDSIQKACVTPVIRLNLIDLPQYFHELVKTWLYQKNSRVEVIWRENVWSRCHNLLWIFYHPLKALKNRDRLNETISVNIVYQIILHQRPYV